MNTLMAIVSAVALTLVFRKVGPPVPDFWPAIGRLFVALAVLRAGALWMQHQKPAAPLRALLVGSGLAGLLVFGRDIALGAQPQIPLTALVGVFIVVSCVLAILTFVVERLTAALTAESTNV